jgi:hypothetical protein
VAKVALEDSLTILAVQVVLLVGLVDHLISRHHKLLEKREFLIALKAAQVGERLGWSSGDSLAVKIVHEELSELVVLVMRLLVALALHGRHHDAVRLHQSFIIYIRTSLEL